MVMTMKMMMMMMMMIMMMIMMTERSLKLTLHCMMHVYRPFNLETPSSNEEILVIFTHKMLKIQFKVSIEFVRSILCISTNGQAGHALGQ